MHTAGGVLRCRLLSLVTVTVLLSAGAGKAPCSASSSPLQHGFCPGSAPTTAPGSQAASAWNLFLSRSSKVPEAAVAGALGASVQAQDRGQVRPPYPLPCFCSGACESLSSSGSFSP